MKHLKVPKWAFKPDQWSKAFLCGLTKMISSWENLRVWEIGVGTGVNIVTLYPQTQYTQWYFSDYDPRAVPLTMYNLKRILGTEHERINPLSGSWDLVIPPVDSELKAPKVDIIFGCLPQVPMQLNSSLGDDHLAHYYDPNRYPQAHLNMLGLGLVETLLVDARKVLTYKGSVVLNLGGRPGHKRLLELFRQTGYTTRIVHSETIEQHKGTSLASLAILEKNGHDGFEFFADPLCSKLINAHKAEKRRLSGRKVYHKIYVIAGKLM